MGIVMWLVDYYQVMFWLIVMDCFDYCGDFVWMVVVIVYQYYVVIFDLQFVVDLEVLVYVLEVGQFLDDGFVGDVFVGSDDDGCQGIQYVVQVGYVY